MSMIPRALVAEVLNVSEDQLPPGDLPVARLAARFLDFLRETFEAESPNAHPEFWTFALVSELTERQPELALAMILACLPLAEDRDQLDLIAGGPLQDLLNVQGEAILPALTAEAPKNARLRLALTGVTAEGSAGTPLWRAIRVLAETESSLDEEGPLPA